MKYLVDVVNLNSDASCLSSSRWLEILRGEENSYLYNWLNLYANSGKKVVLGLTGACIADMVRFNPETVSLINSRPDIFELVLRPFSHDISLLRSKEGFLKNYMLGKASVEKEFNNVSNYFLPPEFMLTNEQIKILSGCGVEGTFINPSRFKKEVEKRIPKYPYFINGLFNSKLKCISFTGNLTQQYLNTLHSYDFCGWNNSILNAEKEIEFCWRDGESSFFLPDGLEREKYWLINESPGINRLFLNEAVNKINFEGDEHLSQNGFIKYYPVHSFTAWVKEFRLLGFIHKLEKIEERLASMSDEGVLLWLALINSDILSAVEKNSPVIKIKNSSCDADEAEYTIWRSARGFEGEEYMALLTLSENFDEFNSILYDTHSPHIIKLRERMHYYRDLLADGSEAVFSSQSAI